MYGVCRQQCCARSECQDSAWSQRPYLRLPAEVWGRFPEWSVFNVRVRIVHESEVHDVQRTLAEQLLYVRRHGRTALSADVRLPGWLS